MVTDKNTKYKRMKILVILSIISFAAVSLMLFYNKSLGVFLYETDFKLNKDTESLTKLCFSLSDTDKYNKKIQYYPEMINYDDFSKYIKTYQISRNTDNVERLYDNFLSEYLISYLFTNRYDEFKEKFSLYSSKFRTIGYKYEYLMVTVNNANTSVEQDKVILETLQKIMPSTEQNWAEQMGNLNVQGFIYEKLGNSEQVEKIGKEIEYILNNKKKGK